MARLSKNQKFFLERQHVSLSSVFDATGLERSEYYKSMKLLDKELAMGVTACAKGGHRLRTRSGHCVQCNTASLAFQSRHSAVGFVYIAGSIALNVIKAGFSKSVEDRIINLNTLGYGGADDWVCLYWVKTKNAGEIEFQTHSALEQYAAPKTYERYGCEVNCLETFSCDAALAISEIINLVEPNSESWEIGDTSAYQFDTLTGRGFVRKGMSGTSVSAKPDAISTRVQTTKKNETAQKKKKAVKKKVTKKKAVKKRAVKKKLKSKRIIKEKPPGLHVNETINEERKENITNDLAHTGSEPFEFRWWHFVIALLVIRVVVKVFEQM